MEFLEPEYVLNIHTHDPDYVNLENDIVLYNPDKNSIMMKSIEN